MPTSHLLYLHGFRSSPQSTKARMVAARVARDHPGLVWWCPQLPPSPQAAMQMLWQGIADWPQATLAVIGSSLGGCYASVIANRTGCKAVLLNPALHPARDLQKYIGEQRAWHDPGTRFMVEPHYIDELRVLEHPGLQHPQQVLAVVAQGDEVLDWREMLIFVRGAQLILLPGSDHALSDFDDHLDAVLAFLDL